MRKSSDRLGFKTVGDPEQVATPRAGASLLLDLFRHLELGGGGGQGVAAEEVEQGLRHGQMVESFVLLSALGGECSDDMRRLRDDEGLAAMLGYQPRAAETPRQWLDPIHDETALARERQQGTFISAESWPVAALKELNRRIVWAYVANVKLGSEVTLDVDAQLIETSKANARYCYEGYKAYPPMQVC